MEKTPNSFLNCNVTINNVYQEAAGPTLATELNPATLQQVADGTVPVVSAPQKPFLVQKTVSKETIPAILYMAMRMQGRLDEFIDKKDGWINVPDTMLLEGLQRNLDHLKIALKGDTTTDLITEYVADAANYLMMLADKRTAWCEW